MLLSFLVPLLVDLALLSFYEMVASFTGAFLRFFTTVFWAVPVLPCLRGTLCSLDGQSAGCSSTVARPRLLANFLTVVGLSSFRPRPARAP